MLRLVPLGLLLSLAPVAAVAAQTYRLERQIFFPEPVRVTGPPSAYGLVGAGDATFTTPGMTFRGWYVPSRNRAAVILVHGAGGNRASLAVEGKALSEAGFGVLLFDLPGHGASDGAIHWDAGERAALHAAIDWVVARADVSPEQVGGFGFSMGGHVVCQVAAEDTRLRAVALAGTPTNQREQVRFQHGRFWLVGEWAALFALRRGGMNVDVRRPVDEVRALAPRPLLVIGGTADRVVPIAMASEMVAAAGTPKELYVIDRAGHGDYAARAGDDYLRRVTNFFGRALLGVHA